jgi:hypothetical protein
MFAIEVTRPNGKKFLQSSPFGTYVRECPIEVSKMIKRCEENTCFYEGTKYERVKVKKKGSSYVRV